MLNNLDKVFYDHIDPKSIPNDGVVLVRSLVKDKWAIYSVQFNNKRVTGSRWFAGQTKIELMMLMNKTIEQMAEWTHTSNNEMALMY